MSLYVSFVTRSLRRVKKAPPRVRDRPVTVLSVDPCFCMDNVSVNTLRANRSPISATTRTTRWIFRSPSTCAISLPTRCAWLCFFLCPFLCRGCCAFVPGSGMLRNSQF
ncbi:hypothetical protein H257_14038 [Aphanomyces astaci]|uniref:Uncharacterized protein n=1 Tax=Aphanomyces astaci TaxID=112090 RepID=W4FUL1_APHAT|nr:hypothetical protein H257_14038 [Aphanomyces astaci]ETV70348.1 hypothetical protein H257_14038 [Aphanomyces astaci]|eukprot:XP_009840060.1 hypothetical protein H257_14038 [Aphanomyces astaci]